MGKKLGHGITRPMEPGGSDRADTDIHGNGHPFAHGYIYCANFLLTARNSDRDHRRGRTIASLRVARVTGGYRT